MVRKHKVRFLVLVVSAIWVSVLWSATQAFAAGVTPPNPPTCDPQIQTSAVAPYWASYNDFRERRLSVRESLQNIGGCQPCAIDVSSIEADNGVTVETPLPIGIGNLPDAATGNITVRYRVPPGISSFRVHLSAVCRPTPPPPVTTQLVISLTPEHAFVMDGCPTFAPLPPEEEYGPKRFTATVLDLDGNPASGQSVYWSIDDPVHFTVSPHESTFTTDADGKAYLTVYPPWDKLRVPGDQGSTLVTAGVDGAVTARTTFSYCRCDLSLDPLPPDPQPSA